MPLSKIIELFTIRTGMLITAKSKNGVTVEWFDASGKRHVDRMTWQDVQEAC